MADAPVTSPGSTGDSAKKPAVKDSKCPFCGVYFTSSSLGRHLDLWIKEKNPKAPDDIHDIAEIRKIRGNVTRRQARSNVTKREGSTPSSSKQTPIRDQRSPSDTLFNSNLEPSDATRVRVHVNRPNWQTTGVINGLPPFSRDGLSPVDGKRSVPTSSVKMSILRKQHAVEENDRAMAAESALKEVLGIVKAANMRAHPPTPFDFEFFSISFPGLCLRCMPPPRSFSARQKLFPGQETWPLEPPGSVEYDYMKRHIFTKLQEWKVAIGQQEELHQNGSMDEEQQWMTSIAREEDMYHGHFEKSYSDWKTLPIEQKQLDWRFECQKAFAQEQDRHKETADRLDKIEQELYDLRSQMNHSENGALTPGHAKYAPSQLHISRRTAEAFGASQNGMNGQSWDHHSLIEKWKMRIQRERSAQRTLPQGPMPSWTPDNPTNGTSTAHYLQQRVSDQRPIHCSHNPPPEDEDEDLADAPGDDEDDIPGMIDRDMLDPKLQERGFDTTNGNGVVDSEEGYAGERILLGLKGFHPMSNGAGDSGGGMVKENGNDAL